MLYRIRCCCIDPIWWRAAHPCHVRSYGTIQPTPTVAAFCTDIQWRTEVNRRYPNPPTSSDAAAPMLISTIAESDLKFEGVGGTTQVTQFITFIRRKALAASRSRDKEWIADFAATHLDGEAFLWHLNLDQAVQTDWDKLQRALVERYSTQADAQSAKYLPLPIPKKGSYL